MTMTLITRGCTQQVGPWSNIVEDQTGRVAPLRVSVIQAGGSQGTNHGLVGAWDLLVVAELPHRREPVKHE